MITRVLKEESWKKDGSAEREFIESLFRPVDRDVFVHDLNCQLGSPSRWLPADSCKKEDKEAP